jgi:hypothetical protein
MSKRAGAFERKWRDRAGDIPQKRVRSTFSWSDLYDKLQDATPFLGDDYEISIDLKGQKNVLVQIYRRPRDFFDFRTMKAHAPELIYQTTARVQGFPQPELVNAILLVI